MFVLIQQEVFATSFCDLLDDGCAFGSLDSLIDKLDEKQEFVVVDSVTANQNHSLVKSIKEKSPKTKVILIVFEAKTTPEEFDGVVLAAFGALLAFDAIQAIKD